MFKTKHQIKLKQQQTSHYPWFDTKQVGRLQIETSNYCNAACPQCPRSDTRISKTVLNSKTHTLKNYKEWLGSYKWDNLNIVHFCGSVDEPTTNPELIEICKWFMDLGPNVWLVEISTNGGARDEKFWTELGKLSARSEKLKVTWGLDGLEDTNHLYRRNVNWKTVERNFRAYIGAGGHADWQFIIFDHNKHQLNDVKKRVEDEGFEYLRLIQSDRPEVDGIKPVESVVIPDWYPQRNETTKKMVDKKQSLSVVKCPAKTRSNNEAFHKRYGNIFINVDGYVVPCCWMGDPNTLDELWEEHNTIDKKLHNLHHTPLQNIINGYWKNIDDKMQTYPLCVKKCKKLNNSINL